VQFWAGYFDVLINKRIIAAGEWRHGMHGMIFEDVTLARVIDHGLA
jgi:hypothetical protein